MKLSFSKNTQISNLIKICSAEAELFLEERTDMMELKVAFCNFANALKNSVYFSKC